MTRSLPELNLIKLSTGNIQYLHQNSIKSLVLAKRPRHYAITCLLGLLSWYTIAPSTQEEAAAAHQTADWSWVVPGDCTDSPSSSSLFKHTLRIWHLCQKHPRGPCKIHSPSPLLQEGFHAMQLVYIWEKLGGRQQGGQTGEEKAAQAFPESSRWAGWCCTRCCLLCAE